MSIAERTGLVVEDVPRKKKPDLAYDPDFLFDLEQEAEVPPTYEELSIEELRREADCPLYLTMAEWIRRMKASTHCATCGRSCPNCNPKRRVGGGS